MLMITAQRAYTTPLIIAIIIMVVISACYHAVIDWWLGLVAGCRYLWLLSIIMVVVMVKVVAVGLLIACCGASELHLVH